MSFLKYITCSVVFFIEEIFPIKFLTGFDTSRFTLMCMFYNYVLKVS